jgi:hypothetical protein
MRRLAYVALILASTPVDAAACHRYSRWYYPWPQRCHVASRLVPEKLPKFGSGREKPAIELPTDGMPIPALSWKVEGEPDELARARLMLRAALEAR